MSSRITIDTLQSKIEFVVLSLGGKPDEEKEENKRNMDQFDSISAILKLKMKECKDKLKERSSLIENVGFQSKERILLDEEIKQIFDAGEHALREIRAVFKIYQNKNKRKVEQIELENRSRNIDLLRKNLNLLQEEFKLQANRNKKENRKATINESGE